mgnify:FL=1|tara:strand:+ start:146 stop:436 length:291 start_codon:yes stop_codon:yes gene_type:complete
MTPEEYYYKYIRKDNSALYDMRIKSLDWMLECYKKGTIRQKTIVSLIPIEQLHDLLDWLVDRERYEDCVIVKEVIDIIYEPNKSTYEAYIKKEKKN